MKAKGFITVSEVEIPNISQYKEHEKSLSGVEENTTFPIKKPKWLPKIQP